MEWMVVNPQIHSMFASLGSFVQDNYVINPDCLLTLNEIWRRLSVEDGTLRTFRRALGISQVVKKDFLPLLINSKDDDRITDLTIKILAYLTMPVECLLPMEVMLKTDAGRNTIYELNMFLSSCKEAFLDPRATKRVLEHIKSILDNISESKEETSKEFDVLNDSIVLLRNILHIPEFKNGAPVTVTQNQILWNMFAQNVDKVVMNLMTAESKSCLGIVLVQLIALMFKDQHATTLLKLLNIWFETELSESSEDNESNTSPPEIYFGDSSSSSMATSDPTSDSSDNNMGETRSKDNDYIDNQSQKHNHHTTKTSGHHQFKTSHNHNTSLHHSQQQAHSHHHHSRQTHSLSHSHHSQSQHNHSQSQSLGLHSQPHHNHPQSLALHSQQHRSQSQTHSHNQSHHSHHSRGLLNKPQLGLHSSQMSHRNRVQPQHDHLMQQSQPHHSQHHHHSLPQPHHSQQHHYSKSQSHHSQHHHHSQPQPHHLAQTQSHHSQHHSQSQRHHSQPHHHSQSHHSQQKNHSSAKALGNQKKNTVSMRNKNSKQIGKKLAESSSSGSDKQGMSQSGNSHQHGSSFSQPLYSQSGVDMTQHTLMQYQQSQKKECISELSDCGYGTQLETQESISTSSNDDDSHDRDKKPVHQKPSNMIQKARQQNNKVMTSLEKEALRRKKLNRRRRLSSVKALLHHSPSDEDITHLLKEFTVDFLLKGYSSLVTELYHQLLCNSKAKTHTDSSHFFWLITYFLKFAIQLEIDLEHISPVLSVDILFYLTYEGVMLCEQFELAKMKQSDDDLGPCIRRMHLVITAMRELIQAVESYRKIPHQNEEDEQHLNKVQRQICVTEDIRCLFVLMLRQFDPSLQSEQFLKDLIVTNHTLLIFIENMNPHPSRLPLFQSHIKQFAHRDIMRQYGLLLEKFHENGQFVNDCIFTMMHHVAADAEGIATLFQPPILKTFSHICESDFQLCDDWSDLIEYVINKFIKTPKSVTLSMDQKAICRDMNHATRVQPNQGWTEEDCHNLYWYYVQSTNSSDPVGNVLKLYCENGALTKTRIEVIEKLLQQDIITRFQYQELLEKEPIATIKESGWDDDDDGPMQPPDEIETLKSLLIKNNQSEAVYWVQKVLIEACYTKLALMRKSKARAEPVPYYSTYGGGVSVVEDGIPLVAWNCQQSAVMQYQPFILLLHKLGLHLPADAGKAFARIPHFWPPQLLYNTAKRLGPLNHSWNDIDFELADDDEGEISQTKLDDTVTTFQPNSATYFTYTPKPDLGANWMDITLQSKTRLHKTFN